MGLIGGMARTAVIAGTATAVGNRVSRRQSNRWAQKDQAAAYQQEQQYGQPRIRAAAVRPAAVREPQYAPLPQYAQPAICAAAVCAAAVCATRTGSGRCTRSDRGDQVARGAEGPGDPD